MSYQLKVLKDYPLGFWPLTETSGIVAADSSGCGNNGTYVNSVNLTTASGILPLVPGGGSGTLITNSGYVTIPITNDYYAQSIAEAFGTKYSSDNDFTIEAWFSQSIESINLTPIIASLSENIGLFWENGDIVFRVSATEEVRCPVTYSKKAIHVVGTYGVSSINLYIDGAIAASKSLTSAFKFTNTNLTLSLGPTTDVSDSFIIDAPAVYRYALSSKSILRHYVEGSVSASAIQVAYPDQGILFTGTDANIKARFEYSYPVNKLWTDFLDENTYYDSVNKYISFYKTDAVEAKTFVMEDFVMIPSNADLTTSKIEWRNDLGISVESSIDGTTWQNCTNGLPIPQYTKDSFSTTYNLYIRITMSTSDASKYLPRLSFFAITFYSNKDVYADNYGLKATSTTEYYLGSLNYPILSRNYNNGIRTKATAGFYIDSPSSVSSVEMVFTPSTKGANTLFYGLGNAVIGRYSWGATGLISKSNIAKIYVNGLDKTSQTNINNVFIAEEPHHVVIVFTQPVFGQLKFNYQTTGGPTCLYKNIALYSKAFTLNETIAHYNAYVGKPSISISEPVMTLTESTPVFYNNEWIVLQST